MGSIWKGVCTGPMAIFERIEDEMRRELNKYEVGQKYTYPTRSMCLQMANKISRFGFKVKLSKSVYGNFVVEIVGDVFDPEHGLHMENNDI